MHMSYMSIVIGHEHSEYHKHDSELFSPEIASVLIQINVNIFMPAPPSIADQHEQIGMPDFWNSCAAS